MHTIVLAVLLFQSIFISLVQATLYVIAPTAGSTCSGGKPCTVAWLDDGTAPFLSEIGATHVALYNGEHVLVQQIDPVDISVVHALTFTPDPNAGSNSGNYYINFTSVNPVGNPPTQYSQFSPSFNLDSMTGNLKVPVASDTSDIPVPPSVLSPSPNPVSGTSTIHSASSTTDASQSSSAASSASASVSPTSSGSVSSSQSSGTPASSGSVSSTASGTTSSGSSAATSASASKSGSTSQTTGSASGSASTSSTGPAASGAASTGSASTDSTGSASTGTTSTSSAANDQPTTTLTVAPMNSGFTTARTTGTSPLFSDPAPTDAQTTGGVSGSSTSGGARAIAGMALVPATLSSIAFVLSFAFLL